MFIRLQKYGFKVNAQKCLLGKSSVSFFGVIISDEGIKPDPEKIKCLVNSPPPSSKAELQSFLGLCTFLSRFIPKFSKKNADLRTLLKNKVPYQWGKKQENAFNALKQEITSETVVSYFDPEKPCTLWVDASDYTIGGILLQPDGDDFKPVCYVSRSLNQHELKYSPTEKEALGLVWCIEKLHVYLYHINFEVIVDHQPLKFIFNNSNRNSPRIERWQMKLQGYSFNVIYKQGNKNIADFISRIRNNEPSTDSETTKLYVNFVTNNAVPLSMSIEEIRKA